MKPIEPMEPMSQSALKRLMENNIIQAWLVLILAICFGSALAGMQLTLGPKIEENKLNETLSKIPELVLDKQEAEKLAESDAQLDVKPMTVSVEKAAKTATYSVYEAKSPEGERLGWVAKASGQGYADKIELLLGLSADLEKVSGIFVLEQKETPGLGNKIVTDEWRSQYNGAPTSQPLTVVKGGGSGPGQINAITGATISSRSVTDIVNTAIADLKDPLAAKATSGGN